MNKTKRTKPKLVILGSGFGSVTLANKIDYKKYSVLIISPRNYFLFTPLLPSTTVGTIEFRSIIEPIRTLKKELTYYQASCEKILPDQKKIICRGVYDKEEFSVRYDKLVIGVGAKNNTYGIKGVEENCFFLKELKDARNIRQKIIACFEQASNPSLSLNQKKELLHFVVVGGGPTGVEFAAEMHDFLTQDLIRWFPRLCRNFKITLVEATQNILGSFDKKLGQYALKHFKRKNINVLTRSVVQRVEKNKVILKNKETLNCHLIVWSTGIGPHDWIANSFLPKNKQGRILTNESTEVIGYPEIFAIGDCADIQNHNLPATAQVAQQQGKFLARQLNRMATTPQKKLAKFEFRNLGMLAYVGDQKALADLPQIKGRGFTTWLFWRSAYLTKLVSFKNKILVLFDWLKKVFFGRDISRF